MKRMLLALPLLLGACATVTDLRGDEEYTGLYAAGFEMDGFRPCGSEASWWVTEGEELRARYAQVATRPYEEVYVVLRGEAGPEGRYGHMGVYSREIAVLDVVEMRPARDGDCTAR